MRKKLALLVLPAAIAALAAVSASPAISKPQAFSLLGLPETYLPVDGLGVSGPEVGSRVLITERLHRWDGRKAGARVGRTEVLCTTIEPGRTSSRALCVGSYALPKGTILVAGYGRSPVGAGVTIPIAGGTGAYANARGWVRVRDLPGFKTNNEFHLLP
jgi:hypothetical protein